MSTEEVGNKVARQAIALAREEANRKQAPDMAGKAIGKQIKRKSFEFAIRKAKSFAKKMIGGLSMFKKAPEEAAKTATEAGKTAAKTATEAGKTAAKTATKAAMMSNPATIGVVVATKAADKTIEKMKEANRDNVIEGTSKQNEKNGQNKNVVVETALQKISPKFKKVTNINDKINAMKDKASKENNKDDKAIIKGTKDIVNKGVDLKFDR